MAKIKVFWKECKLFLKDLTKPRCRTIEVKFKTPIETSDGERRSFKAKLLKEVSRSTQGGFLQLALDDYPFGELIVSIFPAHAKTMRNGREFCVFCHIDGSLDHVSGIATII